MGVRSVQETSSSPSWLLRNASLLHGESLGLLTSQDVLIASTGRISRIAPSGEIDALHSDELKIVDVSGLLILPGFVNACVDLRKTPVKKLFRYSLM